MTNMTKITGTNRNGDRVTYTFEARDLGYGVSLLRADRVWTLDGTTVRRNKAAGGVVRLLTACEVA